jgi:hypothetical protein
MLKPPLMQRRNIVQTTLIALFIAGSFWVFSSAASNAEASKETCSESIEECSKSNEGGMPAGEIIWENFSRQFISAASAVCP